MLYKTVSETPILKPRTTKVTLAPSKNTTIQPSRTTTQKPTTSVRPIVKVTQRTTTKPTAKIPSPIIVTENQNVVSAIVKRKPEAPISSIEQLRQEIKDYEATHRGEALPMTLEEIEREMAAVDVKLKETSTPKEGISTWILLSGTKPTSVQPEMKVPTYRIEADQKIDKIARVRDQPNDRQNINQQNKKNEDISGKLKNKTKVTTTTKAPIQKIEDIDEEYEEDNEEIEDQVQVEVIPPVKKNKPKPVAIPKKKPQQQTQKPQKQQQQISNDDEGNENSEYAVEVTTKKLRRTTTTTEQPESIQEYPEYETARPNVESTTILTLEPKDADFDLPQDRSPGNLATKKPKRPNANNNKNKKQNQKKKPNKKIDDSGVKNGTKTGLKKPQKNKPMSTQIYNYLAREVMPTVGVGIVGLVVTAGLASYFLGPFAALRRSYDIADRKDDIYHYNNEEYAGSDGQNEEEMFGKVIAGMPDSSFYRNNARPQSSYRPNQIYQAQHQPAQVQYSAYKYNPYNRYRNVPYRPQPYQQSQMQPQMQAQQQYRFNNQINDPQNIEKVVSTSAVIQDSSNDFTGHDESDPSAVEIEQTKAIDYVVDTMDNTLQHRSQFVVGAVPTEIDTDVESETTSSVAVPEHGPRRRRSVYKNSKSLENNEIDNENEIDGIVHVTIMKNTENINKIISTTTTTNSPISSDSDRETETTIIPEYYQPEMPQSSFVEFFRRVLELKVRLGLAFLQNATNSFQRYLRGVEERVDSAPLFTRKSN